MSGLWLILLGVLRDQDLAVISCWQAYWCYHLSLLKQYIVASQLSSFQVYILVLASQMHKHEINSLKDFVHRILKTVVILFLDVTETMSCSLGTHMRKLTEKNHETLILQFSSLFPEKWVWVEEISIIATHY